MTKLYFRHFADDEDGKMGCFESEEMEIPLNIHIDNYEECSEMPEGPCQVEIYGIGSQIEVYETEEAFRASGSPMAEVSLIPIGTFPADPADDSVQPSPHILFAGKVLYVEKNSSAEPDDPNYFLFIQTLEIKVNLYLQYEGEIKEGNTVYGVAWLYGNIG